MEQDKERGHGCRGGEVAGRRGGPAAAGGAGGRTAARVIASAAAIHIIMTAALFTQAPLKIYPEARLGLGRGSDLFGIYQAGSNLLQGRSIYEPDIPSNRDHRTVPYFYFFRYLPPLSYISAPVTLLIGPWTAYWLLFFMNEMLIALAVILIMRWRQYRLSRRTAAAALWLVFTPAGIEQYMGQFSISMAVLMLLLFRFDGRDSRPALVTGAWTSSILLKAFPVLLALPYLRDRLLKRVLLAFALVAATSLPYFLLRPGAVIEFMRLNISPFTVIYKGDFGLQAFIRVICGTVAPSGAGPSFALFGLAIDSCRIVLAASAALVVAAALACTAWIRDMADRRAFDLMLWSCVFFLIYKTVWEYHYVMILPALSAAILVTGSPWVVASGILIALPTLFPLMPALGIDPAAPVSEWPAAFRLLYFSVKAVPVLCLFIWTLARARRAR